jgi:hypothetical protein
MPMTIKIKKIVVGWTNALILTDENKLVIQNLKYFESKELMDTLSLFQTHNPGFR